LFIHGRIALLDSAQVLESRAPQAVGSSASDEIDGDDGNRPIAELRSLGFTISNSLFTEPSRLTGTALRVPVSRVLAKSACRDSFTRHLYALQRRRVPVCLMLSELGGKGQSNVLDTYQRFCHLLRDSTYPPNLSNLPLSLAIQSHQLPLEAFALVSDATLGCGPRYVMLDGLQMSTQRDARVEACSQANWMSIWRRRRSERPIRPAYGGFVRSRCPLLASEVASGILPLSGLAVPAGSAWLPVGLNLTRFANGCGDIEWFRLGPALCRMLNVIDEHQDRLSWSTKEQQHDAAENRRLALHLHGIGDLVRRQRRNPESLDCQQRVHDVVLRICSALQQESRRQAARVGPLPGLGRRLPGAQFSRERRDCFERHFHDALTKHSVRHRNLLVMSPYSVLPNGPVVDPAFGELLPVIACADAWSFANPSRCENWNVKQFMHFHRRAHAIIRGTEQASSIAAQV